MSGKDASEPLAIDLSRLEQLPGSLAATGASRLERQGDQMLRAHNADGHAFVIDYTSRSHRFLHQRVVSRQELYWHAMDDDVLA
jgi:hypothetical protein